MIDIDQAQVNRGQGCLVGQLVGDNLGALVEFSDPQTIARKYPNGVRTLADGGTWSILAGQPTDDSELALSLARSLVKERKFLRHDVLESYKAWYGSRPFDCGNTIASGLRGVPNPASEANGALMRVSPLGVYAAGTIAALVVDEVGTVDFSKIDQAAAMDAQLTHPSRTCVEINQLFVRTISLAIQTGLNGKDLYDRILTWATQMNVDAKVLDWTRLARKKKPDTYTYQMGWVRIAWQNALYQLCHTPSVEDALADTIAEGGDTDTNAAICGALLGAVYGVDSMPRQWVDTLETCKPSDDNPLAFEPRPACYWPCDALDLAQALLRAGVETGGHGWIG
jgi:ADP-ribosylglycohydrolase